MFDWLRSGQKAQDIEEQRKSRVEMEMLLLLPVARDLKAAEGLMAKVNAAARLVSAAIILRKAYGFDAVEPDCPAFRMLEGFAEGGDTSASRSILESLLRHLETCEGDDTRTFLRIAWMLNPSRVNRAIADMLAEEAKIGA